MAEGKKGKERVEVRVRLAERKSDSFGAEWNLSLVSLKSPRWR